MDKSRNWKANIKGYQATHRWARKYLKRPESCEVCSVSDTRFEWANISGLYDRDRSDWKYLCIPCHRSMDYAGAIRLVEATHLESGEKETYHNLKLASEATGLSRTAINNCLMGRSAYSGSFVWRYNS